MSQLNDDHIKRWILEHYRQLCADHGTAPTTAQIEEIKSEAGTHKDPRVMKLFEYALLYFLPRFAVVFEEDTLLLGWIRRPDGTKQEIWYKLHDTNADYNLSRVYLQRGAPQGLVHKIKATDHICDEWHPSLTAICAPVIRANEHLRYAYFTAIVRLMRASRTPASIDSSTKDRPRLFITLRRAMPDEAPGQNITTAPAPRLTLKQRHKMVDPEICEDMDSNQDEALSGSESPPTNRSRAMRLRSRTVDGVNRTTRFEDNYGLDTSPKRVERSVVIDLTESDLEESIKSEPEATTAPLND
ncbi:hypothetical protein M436DRAFT_81393 [Aureobasidium namibiae CBS 147.97]|uniref:Uncharacterized protein n=1 Tax=Aureobasidium namibiae CBS 147.97 TaxID=1043004 RepID=A0A074WLH5_9PEZI